MNKLKSIKISRILLNAVLIIFSLSCIVPFLVLISISFSEEMLINRFGYSVLPRGFDITAYAYIFKNPSVLLDAYMVTILSAVAGTLLSVTVMSLAAYPLSRDYLKHKKVITYYIFFTMLFSGGLVPSYILITQYLKLGNSFYVYVIPGLVNVWYIFLLRTFFKGIPTSLIESAHLDGASEIKIFIFVIIPLSKPVLATIALFGVLTRWNDWYTSLLYISNQRLYTLQYLLQKILINLQTLKDNMLNMPSFAVEESMVNLPSETLRMAMAVVAAGPMILVFPFFQKYFVRGLIIGSIKG